MNKILDLRAPVGKSESMTVDANQLPSTPLYTEAKRQAEEWKKQHNQWRYEEKCARDQSFEAIMNPKKGG